MEWINFIKKPPQEKGNYLTAVSGVGVTPPYAYCVSYWDGNFFTNIYSNMQYPVSNSSGKGVIYSASVMYYAFINVPA